MFILRETAALHSRGFHWMPDSRPWTMRIIFLLNARYLMRCVNARFMRPRPIRAFSLSLGSFRSSNYHRTSSGKCPSENSLSSLDLPRDQQRNDHPRRGNELAKLYLMRKCVFVCENIRQRIKRILHSLGNTIFRYYRCNIFTLTGNCSECNFCKTQRSDLWKILHV